MILKLRAKARRLAAKALFRNTVRTAAREPAVSITFDDFPSNALSVGGALVRSFGGRATYFVAGGLEGSTTVCGEMFTRDDILRARTDGHEIGCHTYDHTAARKAGRATFLASIKKNGEWLEALDSTLVPSVFSYPLGDVPLFAKRFAASRFVASRSVERGTNGVNVDLNLLRANALYDRHDSRQYRDDLAALIRTAVEAGAWCIFYTHDVSEEPSKYGCTPDLLKFVLSQATNARIPILAVTAALVSRGLQESGVETSL